MPPENRPELRHEEIESRQLIALYVAGRLAAEDVERFEDHYLDCARCLEQLELAQAFRDGFARVAAEAGANTPVQSASGSARRAPRRWVLAAGAALALALVGGSVLQTLRLGRVVEKEGARAARAESRAAEAERRARAGEEEARAARRAELELRESAGRTPATAPPDRTARGEPAAALLVTLLPLRSAAGEPPVQSFELPRERAWIALALDLDLAEEGGPFSVAIDREGKRVWSADRLRPQGGTLAVVFPSSALAPGDHRLTLEAAAAEGPPRRVARFAFRVLAARAPAGR